ncbi:MAG: EamA family transporter [Muribaculaceae bacterium]
MKKLSKSAIIGYPAGIITGIAYGLNPLFGMPLLRAGASVESVLFFRYSFAVLLLGAYLVLRRQSFSVSRKQATVLLLLGALYTASSVCLFESYRYIASGLATTLVFLYPALVAVIMVFLRVVPSLPVWVAIFATFAGVAFMTYGGSDGSLNPLGVTLAIGSALAYALFIVVINRNRAIKDVSDTLLTFYTLCVGAVFFMTRILISGHDVTAGISGAGAWLNLIGLALLPTVVSTATLAVATRNIGATKASVLGVFEPITAILVGAVALGETLTTNIIVGISVSVVAVTFMIAMTKR